MLHELAGKLGGRFKLTIAVQKRLVQLMLDRNDVMTKNCGGRPLRLVVESLAKETLELKAPEEAGQTEE